MNGKLLVGLLLVAASVSAQSTTVLGSGTSFSNAGASNIVDPACAAAINTWCARNVRNNGAVGITTTYARSGNGSLEFSGPNGSSYKSDFEYYLDPTSQFTLNNLQSLGYDWFRSSSSGATSHFAPALRLILADNSYLVYEPALNGPTKNVIFSQPTDNWQTASFGNDGFVWWTKEGTQLAYSLADWKAGRTTSNSLFLDGTAVVVGFSTGIGSGWTGSFSGAVDNVSYKTSQMEIVKSFNFEVARSTVPEPSTYALMAAGLAVVGVATRRRRRAA